MIQLVIFFSYFLAFWKPTTETKAIELNHFFGANPLQLNQKYTTLLGDTILITRFSYYISNIQLKDEKGRVWKEKESYHYVHVQDSPNIKLTLKEVPTRKYVSLRFSIGIDSLRNRKGAQKDALDPLNGMFWTWEQGYVFLKMEGYCFLENATRSGLIVHIGRDACYRTLEFALTNPNPFVFQVDAQKLFGGFEGASIDLKVSQGGSINVMGGEKAPKIADNYAKMFQKL